MQPRPLLRPCPAETARLTVVLALLVTLTCPASHFSSHIGEGTKFLELTTGHWGLKPAHDAMPAGRLIGRVVVGLGGTSGVGTLIDTFSIGGAPGRMTFDPSDHKLLVVTGGGLRSGLGNLTVVDPLARIVDSRIALGLGPDGIVFDSANGHAYVSRSQSVGEVSITTNSVIASINTGSYASGGIGLNPRNGELFITDTGGGGRVYVLSTLSGQLVTSVTVGRNTEEAAYNPTDGNVYVTSGEAGNISIIDGSSNALLAQIPIGGSAQGVVVDPTSGLIYVAAAGVGGPAIVVISPVSHKIVSSVPLPWPACDLAYVNASSELLVTSGVSQRDISGGPQPPENITVISTTTLSIVGTITTPHATTGIAYDYTDNSVYASEPIAGRVDVISVAAANTTAPPSGPVGIGSSVLGLSPPFTAALFGAIALAATIPVVLVLLRRRRSRAEWSPPRVGPPPGI
jgi:YVTN family beta-propeller protein